MMRCAHRHSIDRFTSRDAAPMWVPRVVGVCCLAPRRTGGVFCRGRSDLATREKKAATRVVTSVPGRVHTSHRRATSDT
eukprot:3321446-Prymnesium_polylepis.2